MAFYPNVIAQFKDVDDIQQDLKRIEKKLQKMQSNLAKQKTSTEKGDTRKSLASVNSQTANKSLLAKAQEMWHNKKSKEEILNVVSEVSNMFDGNTCSMINKNNNIFGLRVAPPKAFHGESVNISEVDIENNFIGTAQTDFGDMTVNIGFNRGENEWMSVL